MENRKVKIGISAKQTEGGEGYPAEPFVMNIICEGEITDDGDNIYIEYEEHLSDDGGVTHTKITFSKSRPETVSLIRSGEVNTICSFTAGERYACSYDMGGLLLDFCIVTKTLKNNMSFGGGSISMSYNMEVRGIAMSRNEYKLTVIKNK